MLDTTKVAIRGTTQDHLEVEDIQDDLIILKGRACAMILTTGAINFGLLSEREQEAAVYAYGALLNSLSFPVQILIRSKKKDISQYLRLIEDFEEKETRPKIKERLEKYKQFVKETVHKNEVLDKKFYIVIPMNALELGLAKTFSLPFGGPKNLPFDKKYILERAKTILTPRREHILGQLGRMGLKGRQLNNTELIQLLFEIHNPSTKGQQISPSFQYGFPFVRSTKTLSPQENLTPTIQQNHSDDALHLEKQIGDLIKKAAQT